MPGSSAVTSKEQKEYGLNTSMPVTVSKTVLSVFFKQQFVGTSTSIHGLLTITTTFEEKQILRTRNVAARGVIHVVA